MTDSVVLMDCHEAAASLHVSVPTVRRWGRAGLLDARRVGPWLVRYTVESVEKLKHTDSARTKPGEIT